MPKYPPGLEKPIGSELKEKREKEFRALMREIANNPHYLDDKKMEEMVNKIIDKGQRKSTKRRSTKRRSAKRKSTKRRSTKRKI